MYPSTTEIPLSRGGLLIQSSGVKEHTLTVYTRPSTPWGAESFVIPVSLVDLMLIRDDMDSLLLRIEHSGGGDF